MTLKEIMRIKGISIEELANMVDVPVETIRNIYYEKTKDPRISTIIKLCDAMDISLNMLLGVREKDYEEQKLLEAYRKCNKRGKNVAQLVLEMNEYKKTNSNKIEVLIPSDHEEDGIINSLCTSEWISTPDVRAYCGYRIMTNNFVNYKICYGDTILVEKRVPNEHEKGVFYKDGKSYFRILEKDKGKYILKAMNSCGEDFILNRLDDFVVVGTCIRII